jgi:Ca2+-binding EF-hand superfamily protein
MTRIPALAAILAALALPAAAQYSAWTWEAWDADGDGAVDRAEYDAGYSASDPFAAFDADGDGRLSDAEIVAATYAMIDSDGDGVLTAAEWRGFVGARLNEGAEGLDLAAWDRDGDGLVGRGEFASVAVDRELIGALFGTYDRDDDGFLSEAEFGRAVFSYADADNDQQVALSEVLFTGG